MIGMLMFIGLSLSVQDLVGLLLIVSVMIIIRKLFVLIPDFFQGMMKQ